MKNNNIETPSDENFKAEKKIIYTMRTGREDHYQHFKYMKEHAKEKNGKTIFPAHINYNINERITSSDQIESLSITPTSRTNVKNFFKASKGGSYMWIIGSANDYVEPKWRFFGRILPGVKFKKDVKRRVVCTEKAANKEGLTQAECREKCKGYTGNWIDVEGFYHKPIEKRKMVNLFEEFNIKNDNGKSWKGNRRKTCTSVSQGEIHELASYLYQRKI